MLLENMTPIQRAEHAVEFYETALAACIDRGFDPGKYPELLEQAKTRLNRLLVGNANTTSIVRSLNMDPKMLAIEAEYNRLEKELGL